MAMQNDNIQVQRSRNGDNVRLGQIETPQPIVRPQKESPHALQGKVLVSTEKNDVADSRGNRRDLKLAANLLNRIRPGLNDRYEIRINHEYNKLQLHLVDRSSGELIQKIPSNHLLAFYDNIEKMTGFLFEDKA